MSEDYRVNKRSNQEVRALAERAKKFYRVDKHRPVNVVRCLQSGWVETEQGRKTLRYEIRSDEEMGADDARTEFTSHTVVISVRSSVHNAALFGDGRARMTLAHELGHAVMHFGAPKSRRMGASGATAVAQINASESAEHQAKVFGPAFLIHEEGARDLGVRKRFLSNSASASQPLRYPMNVSSKRQSALGPSNGLNATTKPSKRRLPRALRR